MNTRIRFSRRKSLGSRLTKVVIVLFSILVWGCVNQDSPRFGAATSVPAPKPDSIAELRASFRRNYNQAIDHHAHTMRQGAPIITQDLLNMTLMRMNGEKVRFIMNKQTYFLMAHTSHPPLTIYAIIANGGFGRLTTVQRDALASYQAVIASAESHVDTLLVHIDIRARIRTIFLESWRFIAHILESEMVTRDAFIRYVTPLRPLIHKNLNIGAAEQLSQFKEQMQRWRTDYPQENWDGLRVVVMGFHQPRDKYALLLFFRWLLHEPDYEMRVSFAEFQHSIFGQARPRAEELALLLATKIDFELTASEAIFGDARFLQSDVMGPAAEQMIREWGESDW